MPVKKHKCKYCKEYQENTIKINSGRFCNLDHASAWAIEKRQKDKEKVANKAFRARKKAFKDNDMKTRRRAVKEACHAYIRYRDRNESCICCGNPLGDNFHAGHYLESGNNPRIRYDENNIHGQRAYCNTYKGGDSGSYKENLIKKIGVFEYWCLQMKKGGTDKRTAQDLKEIELYYKNKLKQLMTLHSISPSI